MVRLSSILLCTVLFFPAVVTAETAATSPEICAKRFHSALAGSPSEAFARAKAARIDPASGIHVGAETGLRFAVDDRSRSGDEKRALDTAGRLAKGGAGPEWLDSANDRWIVDRVIADLSEFFAQGPAPYLCGGVESYVEALQTYLDRVDGIGRRSLDRLTAVQESRTRSSIETALRAMRPVPVPHYAPERRPIALVKSGGALAPLIALRRDRQETVSVGSHLLRVSQGPRSPLYGPQIDPDLPIRRAPTLPLDTPEAREKAIGLLLVGAENGGFLSGREHETAAGAGAGPSGVNAVREGAFETAAGVLSAEAGWMSDRLISHDLEAALSDVELLHVLAAALATGGDPVLSAIEDTLAAILAARRTAASGS